MYIHNLISVANLTVMPPPTNLEHTPQTPQSIGAEVVRSQLTETPVAPEYNYIHTSPLQTSTWGLGTHFAKAMINNFSGDISPQGSPTSAATSPLSTSTFPRTPPPVVPVEETISTSVEEPAPTPFEETSD